MKLTKLITMSSAVLMLTGAGTTVAQAAVNQPQTVQASSIWKYNGQIPVANAYKKDLGTPILNHAEYLNATKGWRVSDYPYKLNGKNHIKVTWWKHAHPRFAVDGSYHQSDEDLGNVAPNIQRCLALGTLTVNSRKYYISNTNPYVTLVPVERVNGPVHWATMTHKFSLYSDGNEYNGDHDLGDKSDPDYVMEKGTAIALFKSSVPVQVNYKGKKQMTVIPVGVDAYGVMTPYLIDYDEYLKYAKDGANKNFTYKGEPFTYSVHGQKISNIRFRGLKNGMFSKKRPATKAKIVKELQENARYYQKHLNSEEN